MIWYCTFFLGADFASFGLFFSLTMRGVICSIFLFGGRSEFLLSAGLFLVGTGGLGGGFGVVLDFPDLSFFGIKSSSSSCSFFY